MLLRFLKLYFGTLCLLYNSEKSKSLIQSVLGFFPESTEVKWFFKVGFFQLWWGKERVHLTYSISRNSRLSCFKSKLLLRASRKNGQKFFLIEIFLRTLRCTVPARICSLTFRRKRKPTQQDEIDIFRQGMWLELGGCFIIRINHPGIYNSSKFVHN